MLENDAARRVLFVIFLILPCCGWDGCLPSSTPALQGGFPINTADVFSTSLGLRLGKVPHGGSRVVGQYLNDLPSYSAYSVGRTLSFDRTTDGTGFAFVTD